MNQNLTLLRQKYFQSSTVAGQVHPDLFRLEKECNQGKLLLAKAPQKLLHLEEFDPSGLEQTYRDDGTGAELPKFAIFNLEGDHAFAFEITAKSVPEKGEPCSLFAHIPFEKTQAFVREMNQRRIEAEGVFTRICILLAIVSAISCIVFYHSGMVRGIDPFMLVAGSAFGAFLTYISGITVLDLRWPWKKLVIFSEFDGIIPREVRERARAAKEQFDNLYLIVDQQGHWKSTLLLDPSPMSLDPLLVGELKEGQQRKFFLVDEFDLTGAERYLADEFATKEV
jgi:hypothetical protein